MAKIIIIIIFLLMQNFIELYKLLKVLGKSVGGENAKVPRYEVKW